MKTDDHRHNNMTGQGTYERCGVEQPATAQDPLLVACGKQILESDNSELDSWMFQDSKSVGDLQGIRGL